MTDATTKNSNDVSAEKTPPKRGFWSRLFHNRWFWIGVAIFFVIDLVIAWLIASYQPPFPPSWVGIKYYSFTSDKPISLEDVSSVVDTAKTVQTAVLFFEPVTPEAKRLLPAQLAVTSFTFSDLDVMKIMVADTVAQSLVGVSQVDQPAAARILADPLAAIKLTAIDAAITQSNNITEQETLFNAKLDKAGRLMDPKEFDEDQSKITLAATVAPGSLTDGQKTSDNLVTVDTESAFRLYENDEAKTATVGASLRLPYNGFTFLNDRLVPLRGGRSPLLVLKPGEYQLSPGASLVPITFHLAVQTVEGLPFLRNGVGHGWTSISQRENGIFYPIMTASLFNSLDTDNAQDIDRGEMSNIATYTNLWINHPDDWVRASRTLNRIPVTDGPTRSDVNEISPEMARGLLLLRGWYLPQYSTQEYYMKYLQDSFAAASNPTDKVALAIEIMHVKIENVMNQTFWGTIQMVMNGTTGDTRYNGITSNCVAYSTDLWNTRKQQPYYDPRMLRLVAVPGKLYVEMVPEDVIDLPDADSLPLDQQNVPYNPSN